MGIGEILLVIKAVLEFPKQLSDFIRIMQSTPQEKRQQIMDRIQKELTEFEQGGRPKW